MKYVRTVSISYTKGTAQSLNTVIPYLYRLMPPYNKRSQVISTGMTLQTRTHPTVPHRRFYCELLRKHYLRLPYRRVILSISTTVPNNVIIPTSHARGSRVDHRSAEPLIMVPRPTVEPYVDHIDLIISDKHRRLGFGMEPEGCPHVVSTYTSVGIKTRNVNIAVSSTTTPARVTPR